MRKRRILVCSIFCALSMSLLGVVSGCGATEEKPIVQEDLTFNVSIEGELKEGNIVNLILKDSNDALISDAKIDVTEGNSLVELNGTSLKLLAPGKVSIKITKTGFKEKIYSFEIVEKVVALNKMKATLKGYLYHGETVEVVANDENDKPLTDFNINITKGADFAIAKGNKIMLLDSGEVEGVISKEGYEDYKISFTSQRVEKIKDVKANIEQYNGKLITVRGIVTASYGNTFYLMDGKHGFYVYNMNTMDTTGNPGDGFELGKVVINTPVLVTAKVDNGKYGLQLTGYDGDFIKEACVLKSNMDVTKPEIYEIKNEGELLSLNASKKLAGSRVKITAKFIEGDFSPVEQTKPSNAIFTFKYGDTTFDAKFNKYGSLETVKEYWRKEKIEFGDYVTIESNFTYFNDHISVDLCNEGTYLHNESKDKNNIICEASEKEVVVGSSITLSAKLPEGLEGAVAYEIIKGKDVAKIEGDKLTGTKTGVVTLVAKVGDKTSMPIEIVVKDKAMPSISSVRDLEIGTQVTTKGKVVTFLINGLVITDGTGYLYCISELKNDFYPENLNIKIGDTVTATGIRNNYNKTRQLEVINDATFEVSTGEEVKVEYQKVEQADFKNFTDEELKYGKAVEFSAVVNTYSSTKGTGEFMMAEGDEVGTTYYFNAWGNDKELTPLTKTNVKAIIYKKYLTPISKPGYSLLIVEAKEVVVAPETISLTLESDTIDNRVSFGSATTYADITVGPNGASTNDIELVAIEGADLVEISNDFFHSFKIKAISKPGKVRLQAQTKDGKVKSNIVELTITLYVEV